MSQSVHEKVGKRIRLARKEMGLTQEALAAEIGTTQPKVSRMETGKCNDSISMVEVISKYTHKPMVFFFVDNESEIWDYLTKNGAPARWQVAESEVEYDK